MRLMSKYTLFTFSLSFSFLYLYIRPVDSQPKSHKPNTNKLAKIRKSQELCIKTRDKTLTLFLKPFLPSPPEKEDLSQLLSKRSVLKWE